MHMPKGMTRQGVRDLNTLPAKKNTRQLEKPPNVAKACFHPAAHRRTLPTGDECCGVCGQCFDWYYGNPY